jgi:hypothetical protein
VGVLSLQVEVTWVWEAAVARDTTATIVRDVEGWAALAEREARERVLRAEVESTTALASVREEAYVLI